MFRIVRAVLFVVIIDDWNVAVDVCLIELDVSQMSVKLIRLRAGMRKSN